MVESAKEEGFRAKLARRQLEINSLVCVGLDPLPEKLPHCLRKKFWISSDWKAIAQWMIDIVDSTAPFASMFKLQKAHYEAFRGGDKALQKIVSYIHKFYPDIPVFLDCKRGDIGRTQERYRIAHFEIDGVDGMNFSPYMGSSCMKPLFDPAHPGRAIVGLCYTSNPEAREVQDVLLADGRQYWEFIAKTILRWAWEIGVNENAGLVMAAAYETFKGSGEIFSEHLSKCRQIVGSGLWFLIPGVGTQGGFVEETIKAAYAGPGSIAINSSSDIIFASSGDDYAEASGKKSQILCDQIRAIKTVS
ncbi:MAG: orotidine-5'-phosphate decarboxylase [Parcubacteria group bacterium]|jgi:orotidine-5'-phosphate decarboxylase